MHSALKLSFHEAKLSVPTNFSMERRLPLAEEESDIDMIAIRREEKYEGSGARRGEERGERREERGESHSRL